MASKTPLLTLESQTPVGEFDVVAFSVSFEWDYVNVLTLLRLAGIPRYAAERGPHHPLVVVGGAVTFVNPEPLAPFADVVAAGEGEVLVPSLDRAFREATGRADLLRRLAGERGFYVPSFYEPQYGADGTLTGYAAAAGVADAPMPVRKAAVRTTDALDPPATSIFTPETEFGSRFLVEVVRGCANLCRFCWAGYNYLPVRAFPADRILQLAEAARAARQPRRPRVDRACATTPRSSGSSRGCSRWATASARLRCGSTISPSRSSGFSARAASEASRSRPRPVRIGCGA